MNNQEPTPTDFQEYDGHDHNSSPKLIDVGIAPLGIISIGVVPMGIISIGVVPMGLLSLGVVSMGLISSGLVSMGLAAIGLQTMGLISIGPEGMGNVRIPLNQPLLQEKIEQTTPEGGEQNMPAHDHSHH
jgi:hypothetical protein